MDCNLKTKLLSSSLLEELKYNGSDYMNTQTFRSLLAFYELKLYVWQSSGSCVLSVDVEDDVEESSSVVKLLLTNPPVFEVEYIAFNCIGSLLALYGRKGIMIMQVPRLYNSKLSSSSHSQKSIFCRSWHIAERFFMCINEVSLLQASWYPGSPTCTHIVMLSSDSYLRLYEVTDSQAPVQAINLGGSGYMSSRFTVSFPECYGETPVSFDFGPSENSLSPMISKRIENSSYEETVYPIYILNANGDVFVTRFDLKKTRRSPVLEGPLPMYPPAEDNYGADACSLLCLHSNPPVLVIAMASGVLYHCVVLDNGNSDDGNKEPWSQQSDSCHSECESALYVHGSVELPVFPSTEELEENFSQSISLYKDVVSSNKYHCCFLYGIYSVVLPFIQKLEECTDKSSVDNILPFLQQNDSIVEHMLCTRPLPLVEGVPIIGLAHVIGNKGISLLCLLASWDFECLPLLPSFGSLAPPLLSADLKVTDSGDNGQRGESFEEYICQMLQRSTCTPILKANAFDDSPSSLAFRQWLELLSSAKDRFQKEYIDRLYAVHAQICTRSKILSEHKVQQLAELDRCLKEKEALRNKAEYLAEKYEDARVNQQLVLERIEKVLRTLQSQHPFLSTAEVAMKNNLLSVEEKLKSFRVSLDQIRKKMKYQEEKLKELENANVISGLSNKLQNMNLGETQLKHVKEILHEEGKHMGVLVRTVLTLKKEAAL